jgi:SPP1 gp7 family putative phage head morphogenesis protein
MKTFIRHGTPIQANASIIAKYKRRLKKLFKYASNYIVNNIDKFTKKDYFEDYIEDQQEISKDIDTLDAKSPSSQARIMFAGIQTNLIKIINKKGKKYAEDMLKSVNKDSYSRTKKSLSELLTESVDVNKTSYLLNEQLKAAVEENVQLITNISSDMLTKFQGIVMRSIVEGGAYDIQKELLKVEGMTVKRAKNIAEDQTRKTFGALNATRFKESGIKKFEWNHSSAGQTPRKLHIQLDGEVFSFDDLPVIDERTQVTGIPGQLINCRCYMTPVLELTAEEEEEIKNAT